MTLTEEIAQKLLNAVGHPGELENIRRTYSRNKGPYYAALGDVTSQLQDQLEELADEIWEMQQQKKDLDQQIATLPEKRDGLAQEVQVVEERLNERNARLSESQDILDRAFDLERMGFGAEELTRLYEILAQLAASQGAPPEEGAAQFFQTVKRYEKVVSWDLEATRAEARAAQARADAERWEAESRRRESESKARGSAIDLVEMLLNQGVKSDDLPHWASILGHSGVTAEQLAGLLDQYGSIEALVSTRQAQADKLQFEVSTLESQRQALTDERDNIKAALLALKNEGLKQVRQAGSQVTKLVESLALKAVEVGRIRAEAAELDQWVRIARLLSSGDAELLKQLPREVITRFLNTSLIWTEGPGRDVEVPPPPSLIQRNPLLRNNSLKTSEALAWALYGIYTEEEKKILASGR